MSHNNHQTTNSMMEMLLNRMRGQIPTRASEEEEDEEEEEEEEEEESIINEEEEEEEDEEEDGEEDREEEEEEEEEEEIIERPSKRRRLDDNSQSSSSSQAPPRSVRYPPIPPPPLPSTPPQLQTLPPPPSAPLLGDDHEDDVIPTLDNSSANLSSVAIGSTTTDLFYPLDDMYEDIQQQEYSRHQADGIHIYPDVPPHPHANYLLGLPIKCFLCEYGNTQAEANSEDKDKCYGFVAMVDTIKRGILVRDPLALANDVVRIYFLHIWWPAFEANGNQSPPSLPRLMPKDVLAHIKSHVRHPLIIQSRAVDTTQKLIEVLTNQLTVNKIVDVSVASKLLTSINLLTRQLEFLTKMKVDDSDIRIDPRFAAEIIPLRRYELYISRTGDQSGMVSTTTSAPPSAVTLAREMRIPFGRMPTASPTVATVRDTPRHHSREEPSVNTSVDS